MENHAKFGTSVNQSQSNTHTHIAYIYIYTHKQTVFDRVYILDKKTKVGQTKTKNRTTQIQT